MREKLIELLESVPHAQRLYPDLYVDSIIANGVTIPVQCKDCKHYDQTPIGNRDRCMCTKFLGLTIPRPDDFCSYGKRKGDWNG